MSRRKWVDRKRTWKSCVTQSASSMTFLHLLSHVSVVTSAYTLYIYLAEMLRPRGQTGAKAQLHLSLDHLASFNTSRRDTMNKHSVITRWRKFAEYWKHFVARFNDVHASGYNSAGSVRIRMKFGALRVHCLEMALSDFGRDPRRSKSGRASRNYFCEVNNAQLNNWHRWIRFHTLGLWLRKMVSVRQNSVPG